MTIAERQMNKPLSEVRESLQVYADRGIFRGFNEVRPGRFSFVWLLQHQMELNLDTTRHVLRFRQLLPGITADSPMYTELKSFIAERHDKQLPDHRRIDRRRAEVTCSNRGGFVSISLQVKNNQYTYGVSKIVNLVHELFVLLRESYPDYLVENFDIPQE